MTINLGKMAPKIHIKQQQDFFVLLYNVQVDDVRTQKAIKATNFHWNLSWLN